MRPNAYSEVESLLKTAQNTPHGCVGIVQARPKQERLVPFPDFHPRAVGGLFKLNPHNRQVRPFPKIHPRQWGGWFKLNLRTESRGLLPESHPRQWVDGSSSTYKPRAAACFPNPTHGSGWMVQAQPTQSGGVIPFPESHPRQWGGWFKRSLGCGRPLNPPSGEEEERGRRLRVWAERE